MKRTFTFKQFKDVTNNTKKTEDDFTFPANSSILSLRRRFGSGSINDEHRSAILSEYQIKKEFNLTIMFLG
jgi:hypothetical protein